MAFRNQYGISYDSSFDSILSVIRDIDIHGDAVDERVKNVHAKLDTRTREERGEGKYNLTYAHLRLRGSVGDARRLLDSARATSAPASVVELLQRVVDEATLARTVAEEQQALLSGSGTSAAGPAKSQPWTTVTPEPPEEPGSRVLAIDLDLSDI